MTDDALGLFHCMLLTQHAKLLDCRTSSVILPAHDGLIGIWRNHMPMLCKLGLGIMEVKNIVVEKPDQPGQAFFVIDGGFARISNNIVMILAYDVTGYRGLQIPKLELLLEKARQMPHGDLNAIQKRQHEIKKITLLIKLAKTAGA